MEIGLNKILLLGYSRIAKKRVIPALEQIDSCTSIEIASVSQVPPLAGKIQRIHKSYEQALKSFDGDFVYISLPNYMHDHYFKIAVELGYSCIVDKPAVLEGKTIEYLALKQPQDNQIFAESAVFMAHPAWSQLIQEVGGSESINSVSGFFTMPALHQKDFRMQPEPGGGAAFEYSIFFFLSFIFSHSKIRRN